MTIIQANKYYYERGGADIYMLRVSDWLEAEGNTVVPFAMRHPENKRTPYRAYFPSFVPTEHVRLNWDGARTFGRMFYSIESRRKLSELINETRADVCHIHNIYTQISPSILHAARDWNVPVVMTVHDHHLVSAQYNLWAEGCGRNYRDVGLMRGMFSRFHKNSALASLAQVAAYKFQRFTGLYKKYVDRFQCPSEYIAKQLVAGGFPKEKIEVNHHGIDPDIIQPREDHDGYALFVGRLSAGKGIRTVLRMARHLPDQAFKIVGSGPLEDELHHLAHEHHLDNVEFLGYQSGDSLKELYRGAQAVLIPSRLEEVFPLVALEAMAAGKPVIASRVGGLPEAVHDRHTGFLNHPNDLHGWIESLVRLTHNEDVRRQLGKQAREETETTFHINRHRRRLLQAYEDVIAMKGM